MALLDRCSLEKAVDTLGAERSFVRQDELCLSPLLLFKLLFHFSNQVRELLTIFQVSFLTSHELVCDELSSKSQAYR